MARSPTGGASTTWRWPEPLAASVGEAGEAGEAGETGETEATAGGWVASAAPAPSAAAAAPAVWLPLLADRGALVADAGRWADVGVDEAPANRVARSMAC